MSVREVKLCLLGDAGVGKSSLVLRFVNDRFNENSESTIGASFMSKTIMVDGQTHKMQIWDTAGQEKYRGLAPMYYRGAAGAIVTYDITLAKSFQMLKEWVRELKQLGPSNIVIAIVGNKSDRADARQVDTATGKEYADSVGAIFTEASAKTGQNVEDVFKELSRQLPEDAVSVMKSTVDLVPDDKTAEGDHKGCKC